MHRQPLEGRRSVHQRVPRQARHHDPGYGGAASAQLGIRASSGGRSFILALAHRPRFDNRRNRGLTQRELARAVGLKESALSAIAGFPGRH
jgi:hypothetical protein